MQINVHSRAANAGMPVQYLCGIPYQAVIGHLQLLPREGTQPFWPLQYGPFATKECHYRSNDLSCQSLPRHFRRLQSLSCVHESLASSQAVIGQFQILSYGFFLAISGIRHETMGPCFTCLSQSVIGPLQLFAYGRFLAISGMRPFCLVSPISRYNAAIGHLLPAKRLFDHLNYRHTSHLARYRASGMRRCNQCPPQWDCALVGLISGCFQ